MTDAWLCSTCGAPMAEAVAITVGDRKRPTFAGWECARCGAVHADDVRRLAAVRTGVFTMRHRGPPEDVS